MEAPRFVPGLFPCRKWCQGDGWLRCDQETAPDTPAESVTESALFMTKKSVQLAPNGMLLGG
jgi:hypothetical protein